jgi:hypothetical protein
MDLFLKTLGVIFLAILLVGGLFAALVTWRIWRFFRQIRRQMADTLDRFVVGMVPTAKITLQSVSHPDWTDLERIEEFAGPLRTVGFVDVGMYDVVPAMSRLLVLLHPDEQLYAVVRQQPAHGVSLDLMAPMADETAWVYSTDPQRTLLDPPDFVVARSFPKLAAPMLLARMLADLPDGPRQPVSRAVFPKFYETLWAREFAWRVERGGLTDDEIERATQSSTGGGAIIDQSEMLRLQWDGAVREYYQDQLQDSLLATGRFTAQEWEKIRERVRFVHDKLGWEDLLQLCDLSPVMADDEVGDTQEEQIAREAERIAAAFPPKIAFPRINDLLLPHSRFQKIGTVDGPLAADVYLAPEMDLPGGYYGPDDDD